MKLLDIKVGFSCNNNCVHCVITDKAHAPDYSTDEIKKIIDDNNTCEVYVVTGGEATIRKDLIEICNYIKQNTQGRIVLQSNGRAFSTMSEEEIQEHCNLIDHFLIAFHDVNKNTHNFITASDSWDQTYKAIKRLYSIIGKDRISTQTVVSKINVYTLWDTYSFIQKEFPKVKMNMTFPHPSGNAMNYFDLVVPRYSDVKDEIERCIIDFGELITTEAVPKCYIHPYVNKVRYSEKEMFNPENKISGFDRGSKNGFIEDYVQNNIEEHRKLDECKLCFYNQDCSGVWKEYFESYNDLVPIIKKSFHIFVKSKNFDTFKNVFFESFSKYYRDYIPNLYVLNEDEKYVDFAKKMGFNTKLEQNFLMKKVIEIEDDVKFHNSGLMDIISDLLDKYSIISEENSFWLNCRNNCNFDKDNVYYFDNDVNRVVFDDESVTKYYRHLNLEST